jgi:hypothetical protein
MRAAGGRVRCGACANVFSADAHRLAEPPPPPAEASISQNYIAALLTEDGEPAPADAAPAEPFVPVAIAKLPIEMERVAPASRWRRLGWSTGCVLALLGLAGQYAWHTRDTLALDPRLRPYYAQLCLRAGCALPAYRDFARIRSDALQIRPAPRRPGILLVDAVLSNQAAFAQDFPALEIVFSNMRGRILASRVFLPHEYLESPVQQIAGMSSREPIGVHLEIVDPGEDATNYHLYLREIPSAAD